MSRYFFLALALTSMATSAARAQSGYYNDPTTWSVFPTLTIGGSAVTGMGVPPGTCALNVRGGYTTSGSYGFGGFSRLYMYTNYQTNNPIGTGQWSPAGYESSAALGGISGVPITYYVTKSLPVGPGTYYLKLGVGGGLEPVKYSAPYKVVVDASGTVTEATKLSPNF